MSQPDFLRRIDAKLRDAGIPSMLTGSLASGAYGRARATEDIDLVIDPTSEQLEHLLRSLPTDDYYVSAEAAREAMRARTMFNVIDMASGWKVDLIFLKRQPFEAVKFDRRVPREVLGVSMSLVTPEDSILSKLEWRRESQSDRQYQDAARVAVGQWATLDLAYLRHWAAELGLTAEVEQLLRDAAEMRSE